MSVLRRLVLIRNTLRIFDKRKWLSANNYGGFIDTRMLKREMDSLNIHVSLNI